MEATKAKASVFTPDSASLPTAATAEQCEPGSSSSITSSGKSQCSHAGQHKSLKMLSVMDCNSMNEIVPNGEPMVIDNECFSGHVMLLVRTPDVDDVKEIVPTLDSAQRISKYFKNYKRRFEFQFQIKLKKIPTGPLFLGCEVEEMIKISRWTKGLTGVLLAMIRRINSGFHYSWGIEKDSTDPEDIEAGRYEKTHLSFPVEASMDRIVITKPGESPPQLGYELHETNASVKRRRRMGAGSVDWNIDDTYTMCLWSAYCDWIRWRSMNVPGVRPFSLSIVTGRQPIYLSVYELKDMTPEEYRKKKPPHRRCDIQVYTRLQFSHFQMTEGSLNPRMQKIESLDESSGDTDSEVETESVATDGNDSKKLAAESRNRDSNESC
ncbi:hypothetical protein IV203_005702 [Nitzschia inconspicua]|uniref:Domain of unknown function at the cortex 1 domain-containing protein n=1 Tax=Nitzschia inconspicua TaxID=303405 RepID=A0A9K3PGK9_9STRA|nr:hypothetical protein IV203_005702 [Nitzschia inconspicua]